MATTLSVFFLIGIIFNQNFFIESRSIRSAENMPEQQIVQTITSSDDFLNNLNGYADKPEQLALLFDFDGTLAPISDEPDLTKMSKETEAVLTRLSGYSNIFMAIISGRGISDVKQKVGLQNITYAGNHGFEILFPNGTYWSYDLPQQIRENHKKIVAELEKLAINEAWVEDKNSSISYHYREIPELMAQIEQQKQEAKNIIQKYGFLASDAHFCVDGKPPVQWNKGEAAIKILQANFGDNWSNKVHVIFAGDDTTDEDAMRLLKGHSKTFRVSTDPDIKTYADYRLETPDEVRLLLEFIESKHTSFTKKHLI